MAYIVAQEGSFVMKRRSTYDGIRKGEGAALAALIPDEVGCPIGDLPLQWEEEKTVKKGAGGRYLLGTNSSHNLHEAYRGYGQIVISLRQTPNRTNSLFLLAKEGNEDIGVKEVESHLLTPELGDALLPRPAHFLQPAVNIVYGLKIGVLPIGPGTRSLIEDLEKPVPVEFLPGGLGDEPTSLPFGNRFPQRFRYLFGEQHI